MQEVFQNLLDNAMAGDSDDSGPDASYKGVDYLEAIAEPFGDETIFSSGYNSLFEESTSRPDPVEVA